MIETIAQILAGCLMVLGALFALVAAIGIVRLPDLYTRMHAASKAGTLGSGLMLLAIAINAFDTSVALRALVAILFFLLTAPLSAHLLARAAYLAGYKPTDLTKINDLAYKPSKNKSV